MAANEAMNFSLPMVVTDEVRCAADLAQDGSNGFVVDHQDVDALENAIVGLVKDSNMDDIVTACLAVSRKTPREKECQAP